MPLLDGKLAPFRTAADRKKLIGCTIRYLRSCDIDRSGRRYIFPRVDLVTESKGRNLFLEDGNCLAAGDLVEVVVIQRPDTENGETA